MKLTPHVRNVIGNYKEAVQSLSKLTLEELRTEWESWQLPEEEKPKADKAESDIIPEKPKNKAQERKEAGEKTHKVTVAEPIKFLPTPNPTPVPQLTFAIPPVPVAKPVPPPILLFASPAPKLPTVATQLPLPLPPVLVTQSKTPLDSNYHNRNVSIVRNPCQEAWQIFEENPTLTRQDAILRCLAKGILFNTAATQYNNWNNEQKRKGLR